MTRQLAAPWGRALAGSGVAVIAGLMSYGAGCGPLPAADGENRPALLAAEQQGSNAQTESDAGSPDSACPYNALPWECAGGDPAGHANTIDDGDYENEPGKPQPTEKPVVVDYELAPTVTNTDASGAAFNYRCSLEMSGKDTGYSSITMSRRTLVRRVWGARHEPVQPPPLVQAGRQRKLSPNLGHRLGQARVHLQEGRGHQRLQLAGCGSQHRKAGPVSLRAIDELQLRRQHPDGSQWFVCDAALRVGRPLSLGGSFVRHSLGRMASGEWLDERDCRCPAAPYRRGGDGAGVVESDEQHGKGANVVGVDVQDFGGARGRRRVKHGARPTPGSPTPRRNPRSDRDILRT